MFKNKTEQNRTKQKWWKYNQTGIHTNHEGFWANTIMLRSIAARSSISSHHSKASFRSYIGRPSSEKIRACSDILSDALSGKSHQSLQSSFAVLSSRAIFMFRWIRLSLIQKNTRLEQFVFYLVMWKNSRVLMSHNLAEVYWIFHFKILYWRLKNFRQKCEIRLAELC